MDQDRRPTSIKVGPFTWPIRYDAAELRDLALADGQDMFGVTRPAQMDIIVDDRRPDQAVAETLIHEALHAGIWSYGINLGDEEALVSPLASAVLDILIHNPQLVAFVTDRQ